MDRRLPRQLCCQDFIEEYSAYRDDRMTPEARAAMTSHMASCPSCRRYDRVIRTGVAALREAPEVKPRKPLGVVDVRRRARRAEQNEAEKRTIRTTLSAVLAVAAALYPASFTVPTARNGGQPDSPDL